MYSRARQHGREVECALRSDDLLSADHARVEAFVERQADPPDVLAWVKRIRPVNMHLSFDRLAALVTEQMGRSARDPALYVFLNRRRTLLKALFFDGTGLCVFYKRLDRGRFQLPEPVDDGRVVEMSEEELERLLDGLTPGNDGGKGEPPPTLH